MENEHELDELLRSYKVKNADDRLRDRIMARAIDSKVLVFRKPGYPLMLRNAAMAAAVAAVGFFCGSFTLATTETVAAVQQPAAGFTLIDKAIIGTPNYSEIAL